MPTKPALHESHCLCEHRNVKVWSNLTFLGSILIFQIKASLHTNKYKIAAKLQTKLKYYIWLQKRPNLQLVKYTSNASKVRQFEKIIDNFAPSFYHVGKIA